MFNFLKKQQCEHDRITPDMKSGYCPDCGEYIENHWFITRCATCGLKQRTVFVKEKIGADTKYCRNCGSCSFFIERLNEINIVDINYAVVVKQAVANNSNNISQFWVEPEEDASRKLIASH